MSGTVSETRFSGLKVGDPIALTAAAKPGRQACTTAPDQTTCSAVVHLEIQSGARHWASDAINPKAATIAFIYYPRDNTTRIVLGAVASPTSSPKSISSLDMFGVHLGMGTYSGNRWQMANFLLCAWRKMRINKGQEFVIVGTRRDQRLSML